MIHIRHQVVAGEEVLRINAVILPGAVERHETHEGDVRRVDFLDPHIWITDVLLPERYADGKPVALVLVSAGGDAALERPGNQGRFGGRRVARTARKQRQAGQDCERPIQTGGSAHFGLCTRRVEAGYSSNSLASLTG